MFPLTSEFTHCSYVPFDDLEETTITKGESLNKVLLNSRSSILSTPHTSRLSHDQLCIHEALSTNSVGHPASQVTLIRTVVMSGHLSLDNLTSSILKECS